MPVEFSVAPMLDVTDRHFRIFLRPLSRRMRLYTEMKTCGAILHGERERFLGFDARERPLALQLGGADPDELAACARLADAAGYDEVNLNVGCPSARVKSGEFGACLMAQPDRVARCVEAMRAAIANDAVAVTVKTRIGIDDRDSYQHLTEFIARVAAGGCAHFIIHARKAWLNGLSPKQNRSVPPLDYPRVYRLKRDFPDLRFTINGGITTLREARAHLRHADGVMIGREARCNPWMLRAVDQIIFNDSDRADAPRTRADAVRAYLPHVERQLARGTRLAPMIRPMLGLFHGAPRARSWRRHLSENAHRRGAGVEVIEHALRLVQTDENDVVHDADASAVDLPTLARRERVVLESRRGAE
ncbi:MAG: tRNA dihydrouridine(20/20a) synthase DusA [bacterium]